MILSRHTLQSLTNDVTLPCPLCEHQESRVEEIHTTTPPTRWLIHIKCEYCGSYYLDLETWIKYQDNWEPPSD